MSEPSAALRAAVRRLMSAVQQTAVDVTVQRRDIELLLAVSLSERTARVVPVAPDLHPEQR